MAESEKGQKESFDEIKEEREKAGVILNIKILR